MTALRRMAGVLEEPLNDWIRDYLYAKRIFGAVEHIISIGKDKPAYDDLAVAAFWGLVARVIFDLCKTDEDLRVRLPVTSPPCSKCGKGTKTPKPGPIGKLLKEHLGDLRRDGWKHWPTEHRHSGDCYEIGFDSTFPDVASRGKLSPTIADLAGFSDRVSTAVQPLRFHRNTILAHRSEMPKPAKVDDIRNAFADLDPLLESLYIVATRGKGWRMTLGGVASEDRFAEALVGLMVGTEP